MRRYEAIIVLVCIISLLLCGCSSWLSGEYLWIQPHEGLESGGGNEMVEVASYIELRDELKALVSDGVQEAVISAANLNETSIEFYVSTAVNYILDNTAIGAYAVNKISYEIGTNRGEPVVAFLVDYKHGANEIRNMKQVSSTAEIFAEIENALDKCETYLVLHTMQYESIELTKFINGYANANPDKVMEIPYANLVTYPAQGHERVVEINLVYLTDQQELLEMQRQVQTVFTSAELYVKGTDRVIDAYSRLYSFLMERSDYNLEASITPAYSLLQDATGDSASFANVYAAMCRASGLECSSVSGMRDGAQWTWNVVLYKERYYHIDLLRCSENGEFVLLDGKDMAGYEWDITQYPIN